MQKRANKRLCILLLEDSSMDAILIQASLSEHFKQAFQMDIVTSKSAFLSAISSKEYDLILSDYHLPDLDGFMALEHAKSACPLTPFIIVSGTIGEETAVELLKQGATDYILKDKLGRLSNSIERALKETEELVKSKQASEDLQKMQTMLSSSLESPKDVIILAIDKNYNYLYFNNAHKESMKYAYGKDVTMGMNLMTCISSEIDRVNSKKNYDLALTGVSHSTVQEYGDIEKSYYESLYNPIFNNKNEIIGVSAFARNISDRMNAEKKLKYEHDLAQMYLDVAGVMLMVLDKNGDITLINKKGCEILELEEEAIIGKNWFDHFIPKNIVETVKRVFRNVFVKEIEMVDHYENPVIAASGKEKIINWNNTLLFDIDKNRVGVLSSGEDITERKQIEEQLVHKQKNLLESQRIAHLGTWRLDVKTNKVYWTEELYKMYGFDPTLPPPDYTEHRKLFTPESWETLSRSLALTSSNGIPYELELETVTKDGTNGWMWVRGEAEKNDKGDIVAIWGAAQDITDRVKTLNSLKESEHRLDMFFHQSLTGFFIMMMDIPVYWNDTVDKEKVLDYIFDHQRCTRINQSMIDQYGLSLNDFLLKTPREMFAHDIKGGKDAWRKMLDNQLHHTITDERKADGTQIYIEGDYICIYDSLGRFAGHFGNQQDITARIQKQREIEFVSSHDYLTELYNRRYYFEQLSQYDKPEYHPLGIMMFDVNGLKIVNDAFGHTVGDGALKTLGNILKDTFEQKDVVARIGGDEFAVLVPNTTSEKLQTYKEKIQEAAKKKKIQNVEMSLAIGYELKKNIAEDADEILKLAENHMYRHKTTEGTGVRSRAISAILQTLTEKYDLEKEHSQRVSGLCKLIGQELELKEDEIKGLEQSGLFHDIGKISIPDVILNKPGKLTAEEYEIIKTHTSVGYQILRAADEYSDLAIHALHHHERWDGKGYPSGLKGNDIPLFSRIIGIVDAYEAMTADRPYRQKLSEEYAISEIIRCSGTQFDPKIAKIFVDKILNAKAVS